MPVMIKVLYFCRKHIRLRCAVHVPCNIRYFWMCLGLRMSVFCWIKHRCINTIISLLTSKTITFTRALLWISFFLLGSISQSLVFVSFSHIANAFTHIQMSLYQNKKQHKYFFHGDRLRSQPRPTSLPLFTYTTCHVVWIPNVSYWNNNVIPANLSKLHRLFAEIQKHMEWADESHFCRSNEF